MLLRVYLSVSWAFLLLVRRYASVGISYVPASVCLDVTSWYCIKYQNGCSYRAYFQHTGVPRLVLQCVLTLYFTKLPKVPDRRDVKIKNHRLGQYGAKPHYSTLPFWQLCALKG